MGALKESKLVIQQTKEEDFGTYQVGFWWFCFWAFFSKRSTAHRSSDGISFQNFLFVIDDSGFRAAAVGVYRKCLHYCVINILCICIGLIEDAFYLHLLACTCHALTVLFQCTATNTLGKDVALVELRHRGDSGDQNKEKQMHMRRKQMHQGIVFVLNDAR